MKVNPQQTERWEDNQRQDGLTIREGVHGWVIFPPKGAQPWERCPCCDRTFDEAREARFAADFLYARTGQLKA